MEQLYVLGTGYATATHCYNTCFAIKDEEDYFLEDMKIDTARIHHIFYYP